MNRVLWSAAAAAIASVSLVAAQQPIPAAATRLAARAGMPPRVLPGTRSDVFTTIQGNALNSTNGALPNAAVRLRDARIGQIVDMQLTDKSGLFAFGAVDPGSYIVEIIANDQILAASQLLNANAGEAVSAVVKLPFKTPPFAGVLGSTTPSAAAVTSQAAAAGILAMDVAGSPQSAIK